LHTEILLEKLKGKYWHIKETGCLYTDLFHVVQDVVSGGSFRTGYSDGSSKRDNEPPNFVKGGSYRLFASQDATYSL